MLCETDDLEEFIPAVIEHADEVLAEDAGDAPGFERSRGSGFWWTGTLRSYPQEHMMHSLEKRLIIAQLHRLLAVVTVVKVSVEEETEIKFGYCTEFIILIR